MIQTNSTPLVSLITVNFNQLGLTCQFLDSLIRQDYKNIEVFVIDNASKENPKEHLAQHYPHVKFIGSPENLGFAGGNNLALPHVKGEFLFFVNNDAEVTEGCIARLVEMFSRRPRLGLISPLICYYPKDPNAPEIIQYVGMTRINVITARNETLGKQEVNEGQYRFAEPTGYAHGAAMMIRREVLDNVGAMWEDYFLYYEELDWGERIRKAGYEIWVQPSAKVYHKESMSVGALSPFKTFYINRNRILFMRRNVGGIKFLLFFLFLWLVTIPINSFRYLKAGQLGHLSAFWKAIIWNIYGMLGIKNQHITVLLAKK